MLDCFKDEPNSDEYPLVDVMPGLIYDRNDQCRLTFRHDPNVIGFCDVLLRE